MNSSGLVAMSCRQSPKVNFMRASVVAHPHSEVQVMTRVGAAAAVARAATAPREYPATWKRSMPRWSITASAWATRSSVSIGPSGIDDSPEPGNSTITYR